MDAPTPPPPPDPVATAAAQAKSNKETAVAQYGLNATNQVTPQGNLTYRQIGTWEDGTPRFEATQTYSPGEQQLYELGNRTRENVGNIGVQQSGKIGRLLNDPVNLTNEATEGRLMDLGLRRLAPRFEREGQALETDLINRGIRPGSEAYKTAHREFENTKNDAYNQLLLSGRGQAVQEALTERNQPINEITALLSGSQVSQPNFVNGPNAPVNPVDVAGITMDAYRYGPMAQYQAEVGRQNAMMGGLFGLAAAPLGGWARSGFAKPTGW